jgi:hypothetical protein
MCNPRRIVITATRQIAEAWSREVQRAVRVSALVTGEARVTQQLATSVGAPVLDALDERLGNGIEGWERVERGYRRPVRGGYVEYRTEDHVLEIVAVANDEVEAFGEAAAHLEGCLKREISTDASAAYYDDGYGGRTREVASEEAAAHAERTLDELAKRGVEEAARAAVAAEVERLQEEAAAAASRNLAQQSEARARILEDRARSALAAVGAEARLAFHRVLALGYRDALLALARARGATGVHCSQAGDNLEIEFMLPD